MDMTTRLHNNTSRAVTVEVVDQFDLRRGSRRLIGASRSIDLGRRIGVSGANPELRLRLRVTADTVSAVIMPITIFENSEIYIISHPIRVQYRPALRSIDRLRIIRWAKDLNAYVWCHLFSRPASTSTATNTESATGGDLEQGDLLEAV